MVEKRKDFDDNGNEMSLDAMITSADEIARRFDVTIEAACALSWITFESSWGRQVDRQFLMSKVPDGSTIEIRFRSLWMLTAKRLVRTYRNRQAPTLYYYLDRQQSDEILSGKIEREEINCHINEHANRRITAQSCRGLSDDYNILLDGVPCGFIIESANSGYEVYWLGQLLFENGDLSTIIETLNEMLEQHQLPLSQK